MGCPKPASRASSVRKASFARLSWRCRIRAARASPSAPIDAVGLRNYCATGGFSLRGQPESWHVIARDIVVVGASAGGIDALSTIVEDLPADLPAAIFVVVHMAP